MKKRTIAAALAVGGVLCASVALAVGGTSGDPMISKSYVDGTYTADAVAKAETRIAARHDALYQTALGRLEQKNGEIAALLGGEVNAGTYSGAFSDLRLKQGDTVRVRTGSGFLLLAGGADLACAGKKTVDLSNGWEKGAGALTEGHRYLVAEDTVAVLTVTTPTAVVSLEGYYTVTESAATDYNALADALYTLGLFRGSGTGYGSGYDLEQGPTRVQGLIMFLRLIGEEPAALASAASNPFTDVPAWASPYVAYAYEKGYTRGMDEKTFGAGDALTAGQYVTFLLRALGYQDGGDTPDFTWDTVLDRAAALGVLTPGEQALLAGQPFLRAQVAYLSYFALDARYRDGSGTVLERLSANGTLDAAVATVVRSGVKVQRLA